MCSRKEPAAMLTTQSDSAEWVSLQEATQRLGLDHPTVGQIRSLLHGMALRWCGDEGVWYRLTDVVAAVAWVRDRGAQAQGGLGGCAEREPAELDQWADAHAPTEDELFPLVDGDD